MGANRKTPAKTKKEAPKPKEPIPVTVLSGFLGAGKTTLLEHILRNKAGLRCAVVVNDMAELNIDAALVKGTQLLQTKEKMVELHNGCICCTLREDLIVELRKLAEGPFDAVVIESSGISEPMQVAESFFLEPPDGGPQLQTVARLDNCVTVVDASNFTANLHSADNVTDKYGDEPGQEPCDVKKTPAAPKKQQKGEKNDADDDDDDDDEDDDEEPQEDDRNICHLLTDQVEFANVILLNKSDLVSPEELKGTMDVLRTMNPAAQVIPTTRSAVDLKWLLRTGHFTETFAQKAQGWMADLDVPHTPETLEYGIGSFIYKSSKPFHPQRLYEMLFKYFLVQEIQMVREDIDPNEEEEEEEEESEDTESASDEEEPQQPTKEEREAERRDVAATAAERGVERERAFGKLLRSKGYMWIASPERMTSFGEWNHAGNVGVFRYGGEWKYFPDPTNGLPGGDDVGAEEDMPLPFIDQAPGQRLVFIGQKLNQKAITEALDACLVTSAEHDALNKAIAKVAEPKDAESPFPDPFVSWVPMSMDEMEEGEEEEEDGEPFVCPLPPKKKKDQPADEEKNQKRRQAGEARDPPQKKRHRSE